MMMGGRGSSGGSGGGGLESFFGGMFGDSSAPYDAAMDQYQKWAQKGQDVQDPFLKSGTNAIPQYQDWLGGQKDPSEFINSLMSKYQQSPYAKYQQQQSVLAGQNAASAGGLMGSTPFAQALQENAQNISSGDMQKWLERVLGINTQYGEGVGKMMKGGQDSANALTNMYGDMGKNMGEAAYGEKRGESMDRANMYGGILDMFKNGLFG